MPCGTGIGVIGTGAIVMTSLGKELLQCLLVELRRYQNAVRCVEKDNTAFA
jgi:hypothetical protein